MTAKEVLEKLYWSERYGVADDMYANGCGHGFKPAFSCPNKNCEKRNLHRMIRTVLGEGTPE